MPRNIDCDKAFEVLTRGPFPSGDADDVLVEVHLKVCHECRQIAEALRPAVDLFHEAMDEDEFVDLPGYQGILPEVSESHSVTTMQATVTRLQQSTQQLATYSGHRWLWLWRFTAAAFLGFTVAALIWGMDAAQRAEQKLAMQNANVPPADHAVPLTLTPERISASLASLGLPMNCAINELPSDGSWPAQTADSHDSHAAVSKNYCCTSCHTAGNESTMHVQAISVANACSSCHTSGAAE